MVFSKKTIEKLNKSMSDFTVSKTAFNLTIPVTLTNEIPHIPLYDVLNRNLHSTWAREFLGKASAKHNGVLNSEKIVNGVQSENYKPRQVSFADPKTNKRYLVDLGKIDFSVEGMIETEVDYLMHEMSRYLTKLYPDDFNTVVTLTEAERQSYFNEALHMIHSYFDTEQISIDDQFIDLYLRHRFTTGITPIRSLTGVNQQEQFLISLLNKGDLTVWSGYKNYISPDGIKVLTRESDTYSSNVVESTAYFYGGLNKVCYKSLENSRIKINDLSTLLTEKDFLTVEYQSVVKNLKDFYQIIDCSSFKDVVKQLITEDETTTSLNTYTLQGVISNNLTRVSNWNSLKASVYGSRDVRDLLTVTGSLKFLYSLDETDFSLIPVHSSSTSIELLRQLADSFLITQGVLKDAANIFVVKTGSIIYIDSSLKLLSNIVCSVLQTVFINDVNLKNILEVLNDKRHLQVQIHQDDKLVFKSILDNDFLKSLDLGKVFQHYSYETVDSSYIKIFKYLGDFSTIEESDLDLQRSYSVSFRLLSFNQDPFKDFQSGQLYTTIPLEPLDGTVKNDTAGGIVFKQDYEVSQQIGRSVDFFTKDVSDQSLFGLRLETFERLQDLVTNNLTTQQDFIEGVEVSQFYLNTDLKLQNNPVNLKTCCSICFNENTFSTTESFTTTLYGSMIADDIIVVENTSIQTQLRQQGRMTGLLFNNFGIYEPVIITESFIKDAKLFLKTKNSFESLRNAQNTNCKLILDINSIQDEDFSFETDVKPLVRGLKSKKTLKFDKQHFMQSVVWEPLQRGHLNNLAENIFSDNLDDFADNTVLSQETKIPKSLTDLEWLTILDLSATNTNLSIIQDLIAENKSLYLDSNYKILNWIPLSSKNLIYDEIYKSYTFLERPDLIPSCITFYSSDSVKSDNFSKLLTGEKSVQTIQNLTDFYNRRHMIWGGVVWDRNNETTSIKSLRTIWAGFLSNFEIFNSNDYIPDEFQLKDLVTDIKQTLNQQILNYNYSDNFTHPAVNWLFGIQLPTNGDQVQSVKTAAIYNTNFFKLKSRTLIGSEIVKESINGFSIEGNFLNDSLDQLTLQTIPISDLQSLKADVDLEILEDSNPIQLKYDSNTGFFTDQYSKKLTMFYNQIFLDEDLSNPNSFFQNLDDDILRLILEFYVYSYIQVNVLGWYQPAPEEGLQSVFEKLQLTNKDSRYLASVYPSDQPTTVSRQAWSDRNYTLKLTDILSFASDLETTTPVLVTISNTGKLKLNRYRFERSDSIYRIYVSQVTTDISGDLVYSLLPTQYKQFQVKSSRYTTYLELLQSNQFIAPNAFTGTFKGLDIQFNEDADFSQIVVDNPDNLTGDELLSLKKDVAQSTFESSADLLTDLFSHNIETNGTTLTIDDDIFNLKSLSKNFKEFQYTTIQFSAEASAENTTNQTIQQCNLHFEENFNLTNSGYLYLFDIKAPSRRSNYTGSRETQIIDRNYTIENLHVLAINKPTTDTLRLLIQDSSKSLTRSVSNIIDKIKPVNDLIKSQMIRDDYLTFGFTYPDPGIQIDYTYYKRKFVAEFVTNSIDTTSFALVDQDLIDQDFDLTKHISVGDQVQIQLLNPSSFYQDGVTATFELTGDGNYVGPYKVIYSKTTTESSGSKGLTADIVKIQKIILAGPGNLVYVQLDLDTGDITISEPYFYQPSTATVFVVNDNLVYYDSTQKGIVTIGTCETYCKLQGSVSQIRAAFTSDTEGGTGEGSGGQTVTITESLSMSTSSVSSTVEQTLTSQHTEWYNFDGAGVVTETEVAEGTVVAQSREEVDEDNLQGPNKDVIDADPTVVLDAIPLFDGSLNFDNYDRIYYKPSEDSEEEPSWTTLPDEAEFFDASGNVDAFEVKDTDTGTIDYVKVEDATVGQLVTFIRNQLVDMLGEMSDTVIVAGATEQEVETNAITDEQGDVTGLKHDEKVEISLTPKTHLEAASVAVAKALFRVSSGTIDPTTAPIYVPNFVDLDMPIYLNETSNAKWYKMSVVNGVSNEQLSTGTNIETLQKFARAVLPINYITRSNPNTTSYIKNSQYVITWDQNSGAVTIMDKTGSLQKRIAIPYIGFKQPDVTQSIVDKKSAKAYCIPNRLFVLTNTQGFNEYLSQANKRNIITGKYGIYDIFEKDAPLYMPTVLSEIKNKTKADLSKAGIADEVFVHEMIQLLSDTTTYTNWLTTGKLMDYLAPDACEYEFLKNRRDVDLYKLKEVLTTFGKTTEATYIQNVITAISDTLNPGLVKGLTFLNDDSISGVYSSYDITKPNLPENAGILTSVSTTGSTVYSFESLVETSGISVVDNYLHVYGTIKWPELSKLTTAIKNQITAKVQSSSNAVAEYKDLYATQFAKAVEIEITENFKRFVGEDVTYPKTETSYPFKVTIDLNTYEIVTVENSVKIKTNNPAEISTLVSNGEEVTAITTEGSFSIGDPSSTIMMVEDSEITKFTQNVNKGIVQVYDALKTLDVFGTPVTTHTDGSLEISLRGTMIMNADTYSSVVAQVNKTSFVIRDNVVVLDEGQQTNAIAFVKDMTKDNFQFGYGSVTNIDYIPAATTLFEVNTAQYADFATYENRRSTASLKTTNDGEQLWIKDSVFDLYPTWEEIDEDLRKRFYTIKSDKLCYVENEYGRNILRIVPVFGTVVGGQLVLREKSKIKTVANEYIDSEFLSKLNSATGYLLSDKRSTNYSYEDLQKRYKLQCIPDFVTNPWDAVLTYAYRTEKVELIKNDPIAQVDVFDDYLLATVKLSATGQKTDISKLYTGQKNSSFEKANLVQINNVFSTIDYEEITMDELKNSPSTKNVVTSAGTIMTGYTIDDTSVTTRTVINTTTQTCVTPQSTITISNGSNTVQFSKDITSLLKGDWFVVQQNLTIDSLKLKINNKAETLPYFYNINKYSSRVLKGDLTLNTDNFELYIPEKGYGQSLLGSYTNPADCPFTEGLFYDYSGKTVNINGSQFVLVDANAEPILDSTGSSVLVPRMLYKSFAQADGVLSPELPTREGFEITINDTLINLSLFTVDTQNISFSDEALLDELLFQTVTGTDTDDILQKQRDAIYELFMSDLRISCKMAWSELPADVTNNNVFEVKTDELLAKIGYTRSFNNETVPINYTYRLRDGSYETTKSGYNRDLKRFACSETGEVLYMSTDGEVTTSVTSNPPIPSITKVSDIVFFQLQNGVVNAIIQDTYALSKMTIVGDFDSHSFSCTNKGLTKTILRLQDPNTAFTQFTGISSTRWNDIIIPIKFKFNSDVLNIKYSTKIGSYNFAYLKDKNGELIGKVYFEKPVDSDSLMVFSMID